MTDLSDLPLFDPALGEELKQQGMALAWDNEGTDRRALAVDALRLAAQRNPELWADHLYETMAELGVTDFKPKAIGTVWKEGKRLGWIIPAGRTEKTRRPLAHGRDCPVYRSRLFGQE